MNPAMWQNTEGCTFYVCPDCAATILTRYLILIVGKWSKVQKSYFQKQHVLRESSFRLPSGVIKRKQCFRKNKKSVTRLKLHMAELEKEIQYFRIEISKILLGSPVTHAIVNFIHKLFYFAVPSARKRIFY